jgi:hypothetical protein
MKIKSRSFIASLGLFSASFGFIVPVTDGKSPAVQSEVDTPFQWLYVGVSAPDAIASVIKNGLLKRLREFRDVVIKPTMDEASDVFFVQAIELQNRGDDLTGYAISVVYAERLLLYALESDLSEHADRGIVKGEIHDRAVYAGQFMYVCALDEIYRALDKIVADLDVRVLKPARRESQKVRQEFNSRYE